MTLIESQLLDPSTNTHAFRTYAFGGLFPRNKTQRGPSLARDLATLALSRDRSGHLESDMKRADTSGLTNNREADLLDGDPEPDFHAGQSYCTLQRLCAHAGADWGAAQMGIRNGSLKPDVVAAGQHLFKPGASSRQAVATLSRISRK